MFCARRDEWVRRDSNPRLSDYESAALTAKLPTRRALYIVSRLARLGAARVKAVKSAHTPKPSADAGDIFLAKSEKPQKVARFFISLQAMSRRLPILANV